MPNIDPKRFREEGYCIFRNGLSPAEAEANRRLLDEAIAEGAARHKDRKNYYGEPHAESAAWLDICRHPRVLDAVESVLGPNIILIFSSLFIKQPRDGKPVPWHQDITYWPSVHGTEVATVWLAFDDADAGNAAMQVIPRTHQGYEARPTVQADANAMLGKQAQVTPEMIASAVHMELKAGELSIHDSYVLHGSDGNTSDRRRAGYTIRYASADTAWVDVEKHPIPVYLVRGEAGPRGAGYVDMRPGIPAQAARPG